MNIHYYSCLTLEECRDITLGDCHIREEYIIQSIQAPTAAICQEACFLFADCKNFNFNGSTCLLLKEDYRQECDTTAAPFVRYNNELLITYGIVSDIILLVLYNSVFVVIVPYLFHGYRTRRSMSVLLVLMNLATR